MDLRIAVAAAGRVLDQLGTIDDQHLRVDIATCLSAVQDYNELRRAVADVSGSDVETWPSHGNAGLAIASCCALSRLRGEEVAAHELVQEHLGSVLAPFARFAAHLVDRGNTFTDRLTPIISTGKPGETPVVLVIGDFLALHEFLREK